MNQGNTSPFKFLDSYKKEDKDIFFGRNAEVAELYHALSGVKQLLLYGPSGSGKTSVIECGLRNQFSDADWLAITIRRGNNLNASFFSLINEILRKKIMLDKVSGKPTDNEIGFSQVVEKLYAQSFRPVYLLFDQFEEVLIQGTEDEKKDFFANLNKLIHHKVPCKVILIMREDFIGYLSEFESLCPGLFQNRFRVEKMGKSNVREVILDILSSSHYLSQFDVVNPKELCESILLKLPDNKHEIELAHVQVFLGELWDRAVSADGKKDKPVFRPDLIKENDNLQSVLGGFLKKQFDELDPVFGEKTSLEVLANMITNRQTKLQVSEDELQSHLKADQIELKAPLNSLLKELEIRRIIRTIKVGEFKKFEISHDILAQLIGDSRTEDMKLREKAQELYALHETRTEPFGQGEINNLLLYKQYRAFPDRLNNLINSSQRQIDSEKEEKERLQRKRLKNARITAVVFSVLAIGAMVLFVIAMQAREQAEQSQRAAQESLLETYNSEIRRYEKEIAIETINKASFHNYKATEVEQFVGLKIDSLGKELERYITLRDKIQNSLGMQTKFGKP